MQEVMQEVMRVLSNPTMTYVFMTTVFYIFDKGALAVANECTTDQALKGLLFTFIAGAMHFFEVAFLLVAISTVLAP